MRMRVLTAKLRVKIENQMRVFLESLNFEIEMRVSQKSDYSANFSCFWDLRKKYDYKLAGTNSVGWFLS